MKVRTSVLLIGLLVAAVLMVMATETPAAELPEGISVRVLAEYPSNMPGIEKIRLIEFRMEPGAKWEGFVETSEVAL